MTKNKKIASIIMTLIVGGVTGHHIDDIVEKYNLEIDRYPLNVEYKIIESCISNYDKPIKRNLYMNKKSICICALEKTELVYDYSSYKSDKMNFLDIFEDYSKECM